MNEALVGAGGGLIGAALGSFLSYFFARRAQVSKALHDSRIAAFARFSAAIMEYRRSLMERWFVDNGAQPRPTAADVYQTRSTAWAAMFEVCLLAGSPSLGGLARAAVDTTTEIKNASDHSSMVTQSTAAKVSIDTFVQAARADISADSRVK